ncbi:MAG: hypothetical protein H7Z42_02520, partial [Roseiflexaceae bacterium]|nr:hypothetical protein [Roseiflexaceae bacterium]
AVSGPESVNARTPFGVDLTWNIPDLQVGDRYYGAIDLVTQPTNGVDLGLVKVDLVGTEQYELILPIVGQ